MGSAWGRLSLWLVAMLLLEGAAGNNANTAIDTGDGRVAVALDDRGWISRFRWPGPGGRDQIGVGQSDGGWRGAGWCWYEGGGWRAFDTARWDVRQVYAAPDSLVVVSYFEERDGNRAAMQRVYVPPDTGVLVVQLQLHGFAPDLPFCWYQDFSPSLAPGLTHDTDLQTRSAQGDFATWFNEDPDTLFHFRPEAPGRADWARVRALVDAQPSSTGWDSFEKGVCIATTSPNEIQSAWIAREDVSFHLSGPGPEESASRGCAGPSHAALLLAPEVQGEARLLTALIGAGPDPAAASRSVVEARQRGAADLLQAAETAGGQWLRGAFHVPDQPEISRAVLDLLLCVDRTTGAIVEDPVAANAWTCATVFASAWSAAALDALGYSDAAERALEVHWGTIRGEGTHGLPAGSLPATIFVSGRVAGFTGAADPAAAAWLLAASWRHAARLPAPGAAAYLGPRWPALAKAVDILAREPEAGLILSGGAPVEGASLYLLETHYLGLESARRISIALNLPETGLAGDRRTELYARIRLGRLNGPDRRRTEPDWVARWVAGLTNADADTGWDVLRGPGAGDPLDGSQGIPDAPRALRAALHCLSAAENVGEPREVANSRAGTAP
jgi:hypothetical protein